MRNFLIPSLLFFIVSFSFGQNHITTFDFGQTPQALMLNPSYDMNAQYHITIPILGSHKISAESSGMTAYDLFSKNNIPFIDKIKNTAYQLKSKDYLLVNQKMEIFNIGQRIKRDYYLSYGMYQETDLYSTLPTEMLKLFFEGTSISGKAYAINDFSIQANVLTVYHIGLQTKYSKKTNIGGRLKLYNSPIEVYSSSNKGSIQTNFTDGISHTHHLSDIDIKFKTGGIPIKFTEDDNVATDGDYYLLNVGGKEVNLERKFFVNNLLFGGSKGLGIDLGITHNIKRNLTTAVSINNLGFIFHNKLAQTYGYKGDYTTDALTIEYDPSNSLSYLDQIKESIDKEIPLEISNKGYLSLRPFQAHASIVYALGVNRGNECNYYRNIENSAANKMGVLVYAQYRPGQIIYDANLFYERNFANKVYARVNYTINTYSYTNLGLSVATQLGKFNMFVGINNILSLSNLAKSNNLGIQFGINIVSKKKL